jgi:hypothetical protein
MNLWFDSLTLLGMCFILKYGAILNFLRIPLTTKFKFFKELFSCALCMGFWLGFFFYLVANTYPIGMAFYSAAICWLGDYIVQIIQKHLYD